MAFKIYVESSKGNLYTPWFKITKRRGDTYDNAPIFDIYSGYNLSFYPLRRNISIYTYWWLFGAAVLVYLLSIAALIQDPEADNVRIYALLTQIIMIITASLYATGGFKKPGYVLTLSLVITLPYVIAIFYISNEPAVILVEFLLFSAAYTGISKMSGWGL